MIGYYLQVFHQ